MGTIGLCPERAATVPPSTDPRYWHELPNAPSVGTVLGRRDALPDGQATLSTVEAAPSTPTTPPFRVLLLRSGPEVKAYVNRCAHFGVPLAAKQEQLLFQPHVSITCNVHYARYRWTDGVCDHGECVGEALLAIPVRVDAQGQICIAPASPDASAP